MGEGSFQGELITTWISKKWRRLHQNPHLPFGYVTASGTKIIPPDRMKTDFGSTWPFKHLFPKDEFAPAYVIHDWLYYSKVWRAYFSRQEADYILWESIGVLKGCNIKRAIIYYTLRLFGWIAWNKKNRR